jgi:GNAT superfamily N-acetyltransferase
VASTVVVKAVSSRREVERFIRVPWRIYGQDPLWVPPLLSERRAFLNPRKNPFFAHGEVQLFLAFRGNEPVGTIAAILNHAHTEYHGDATGFFGLFETIDDETVAFALLGAAKEWLRARGMSVMRGPMSFSTHDAVGLLIDGFDLPPAIMMPYNPAYYVRLVEAYGFSKEVDLFAYRADAADSAERLKKVAAWAGRNPHVRVRTVDAARLREEGEFIKRLYNESLVSNWGYVPVTDTEFQKTIKDLRAIIDPDLVLIAEYRNEPVGFYLAVPDYNVCLKAANGRLFPFGIVRFLRAKKTIDFGRLLIVGVMPEHQKRHIGVLLYCRIWETMLRKGYCAAEASWINERNRPMNHALEWMGLKKYKTYRIYDQAIA